MVRKSEIARLTEAGWTQESIAKHLGCSQPYVSSVLKGLGVRRRGAKARTRRKDRVQRQVSEFLSSPRKVAQDLARAERMSPALCFEILRECKEHLNLNHRAAAPLVDNARKLFEKRIARARSSRNPSHERRFTCDLVQAVAMQAVIARKAGDPDLALRWLRDARRMARDCQACLADLARRQTLAYLYRQQFEDALASASEAIDRYRQVAGVGHDLDGRPRESCLANRSLIYMYSSQYALGEKDAVDGLAALPTEARLRSLRLSLLLTKAWCQLELPGHIAVAEGLPAGSRVSDAKVTLFEGLALFDLDREDQHSSLRASVNWLSGVVDGLEGNREAAGWKLGVALDDYLALPSPDEAVVCAADKARLAAVNPEKAQDCLRDLGWPRIPTCLHPYRQRLARLLEPRTALTSAEITHLIDELRDFAAGRTAT